MLPSRGQRVLPGTCCSLGGEGGGDAAPAYPCLSLPVPEPSLRAAVGLRHNLTHGEKGGAGEHRVHAQLGFQLRTSPPGARHCTHFTAWVSEPESLLLCKRNWIWSYWSLFCGPVSLHPRIHHCHRSASLSSLRSCLGCIVPPSASGRAAATVNGSPAPSGRQRASSTHFFPLLCLSTL